MIINLVCMSNTMFKKISIRIHNINVIKETEDNYITQTSNEKTTKRVKKSELMKIDSYTHEYAETTMHYVYCLPEKLEEAKALLLANEKRRAKKFIEIGCRAELFYSENHLFPEIKEETVELREGMWLKPGEEI